MKVTAEQAKRICFNDTEEFEVVEEGDWEQDGKYQYNETIFKLKDKVGRFYSLSMSRSGSPFTDWNYDWEWEDTFDCVEVEQVEITTTVWRKV